MPITVAKLLPHIVVALFTIVMIQTCKPGSSLFSYHPVCMTIANMKKHLAGKQYWTDDEVIAADKNFFGDQEPMNFSAHPRSLQYGQLTRWGDKHLSLPKFTVCMTEAILVLSKNSIFGAFSRDTRILAHWLLLCIGAAMETAGFFAIYTNKIINDKPHFTSWHGLIGLITVILSYFQLSIGVFAKYPRLLSAVVKMKNVKLAHALFGGFVYSLAVATTIISFYSGFSVGAFSHFLWALLFGVQLVLGFVVLRGVYLLYLPRLLR